MILASLSIIYFSFIYLFIRWFWEITHAMTEEDKSKLLAFSTGCGRAPVGGMSEMNFIVVKNGGDCERLVNLTGIRIQVRNTKFVI